MFPTEPVPYPKPRVVAEVGKGCVGDPGPEVATPAPQHRVEPEEQGIQLLVRADLSAQRLDFPGDGPQGLLGRIGVDVAPVAASFAVALDAPTEKVEALIDVGDQSLVRR